MPFEGMRAKPRIKAAVIVALACAASLSAARAAQCGLESTAEPAMATDPTYGEAYRRTMEDKHREPTYAEVFLTYARMQDPHKPLVLHSAFPACDNKTG